MTAEPTRDNPRAYPNNAEILEACRIAVGNALLKHKLLRQPIVVVDRDNKPRQVEPDDIETGLTPEEEEEAIRTAGNGTWFSGS
jgi:hypothetical protein